MKAEDIKHNLFFREREQRWVLAYVPTGGTWKRPRQVTAPPDITSRPKARAWADRELEQIRAGGGVHVVKARKGAASLRDLHVELMAVRAKHPDLSAGTLANNWTHLRAQILDPGANPIATASIADVPMAEVDVARARAFVRAVRGRVSANHCRNVAATARMLWDLAQGEGKITSANPFRNILVVSELPAQKNAKRAGGDPDEPIIVPIAACQALANAPDDVVPLERRVRYVLDATSGLDEGELSALRWSSLRLDEPVPYMRVRQSLGLRTKDGFAKPKDTKTENRVRDVPLHPAAIAALDAWRHGWERLVRRKPGDEDFVFAWANGKPQRHKRRADFLRVDLRAVCAAADARGAPRPMGEPAIAEVTFKALRRTFSSALKDEEVAEEDRGKLMGHSGGSVTARNYTRHALARLASIVARIPLSWPAVEPVVPTDGTPPQTGSGNSGDTSVVTGSSEEARIGIEPTYDGFAKCVAVVGTPTSKCHGEAKDAAVALSGNGHEAGNGTDFRPVSGAPTAGPRPGASRIEVDGAIVASTTVAAHEPAGNVAERLALQLRQRTVQARREGVAGLRIGGAS